MLLETHTEGGYSTLIGGYATLIGGYPSSLITARGLSYSKEVSQVGIMISGLSIINTLKK